MATTMATPNASANDARHSSENDALTSLLIETSGSMASPLDMSKITSSQDYLSKLLSLSLDSLKNEPASIKDIRQRNQTQLCDLSFDQYHAFLEVHACAEDIEHAFGQLNTHLGACLDAIPQLEMSSQAFVKVSRDITEARAQNSLIDQQHDRLLDILEIPPLVDTCVRNGYYSEAMDLAAHMQNLSKRHDNVLMKDLDGQVQRAMQLMLNQLLTLLKEPIKLPACIKVVDYLRRMQIFNEPELQLVFLTLRNANLQSSLGTIENESDSARYLKRYVDILREHFFDITTQYQNIFLEAQSSRHQHLSDSIFGKSDAESHVKPYIEHIAPRLLTDYIVGVVNELLRTLEKHVPRLTDAASVNALLTQVGYCGQSLGRVGIDFRQLTAPIFESAVRRLYLEALDQGTGEFIAMVRQAIAYRDDPKWMVSEKQAAAGMPQMLLEFPLLAYLSNVVLTAFNSLRLVAPLSLANELRTLLTEHIKRCSEALVEYANIELDGVKVIDMDTFKRASQVYSSHLLPYIFECFSKIYPDLSEVKSEELALGLSATKAADAADAPEVKPYEIESKPEQTSEPAETMPTETSAAEEQPTATSAAELEPATNGKDKDKEESVPDTV